MTLLLDPEALAARRGVAANELAPLARSLAADLAPLLGREPYIPAAKALLSRDGGRCARDGTLLEFDPHSPHRHVCPACGAEYRGEHHDRFWIYWYQLWLAERAVHAAVLHAAGMGDAHRALAVAIVDGYAERYLAYPNRDNVLGPTRPFFSTYLESIWLLQLCVAVDLLAMAGDRAVVGRAVDRIVEPSARLIADYDEGASNRQVWNNAALLAAARLLDRPDRAARIVDGPSGLLSHLRGGLLADGTWYEGENYHLFAHRGLWYGVRLAEEWGIALPRDAVRRFDEAFATPFVSALPDLTFPARRDSQYGVSLRQWRFAELCELGMARHDDERLAGALARLYLDDVPRRDTGRSRSSAEAERNVPPSALSRADLGWRSLLFARPSLPPLEPIAPRSALLEAQGLAIFRRDAGRAYAALDYGHSGGGHGHPDRLDLLLVHGDARWLDDVGTGSYVDRSLHWYRSTLAHNAPLVAGRSQEKVHGTLLAHDERGAAGWVRAEARIAPAVVVRRTVVAMPDYLVDVVEWTADDAAGAITLDLPMHVDAAVQGGGFAAAPLVGSDGTEDGFRFVHDAECRAVGASETVALSAARGDERLTGWCTPSRAAAGWRATAPGPPGSGERAFQLVRAVAAEGAVRSVWCWNDAVASVEADGDALVVRLGDGTRHAHAPTSEGWRVELHAGASRSTIDLVVGAAADRSAPAEASVPAQRDAIVLSRGVPARFTLGETDYRRSEQTWVDAGSPEATVEIEWTGESLRVRVDVPRSECTFVPAGVVNPYDNEHPDVNGDGVQLYVEGGGVRGGWMLVPEGGESVRARAIDGWDGDAVPRTSWSPSGHGYTLRCEVRLPGAVGSSVEVGLIVNEKPRDRERRRGQLVLGGGRGEFVYLRGDRIDEDRLLCFHLDD